MIAARLRAVSARIDAMSMRERGLIFSSVLVAMVLGAFQFAIGPALADGQRSVSEIEAAQQRIAAADDAVRTQAAALQVDTSRSLVDQIVRAQARMDEIDTLIEARAREIVDPATMARVLQDLLSAQDGLTLLRARNLKPQRLADSSDDTPLYRHTLRLEVAGSYMDVLDYLRKAEALPWRFFWQGLDFDAREYPDNRARIDVSTLSFEEDWIGV